VNIRRARLLPDTQIIIDMPEQMRLVDLGNHVAVEE
jgi:hypothetical protein